MNRNCLGLVGWPVRDLQLHRGVVPDVNHLRAAGHNKLLAKTDIKACNCPTVEWSNLVLELEWLILTAV